MVILYTFGLVQVVKGPMHEWGSCIDHIICNHRQCITPLVAVDYPLHLILWSIEF